jgi:hypothetical protein
MTQKSFGHLTAGAIASAQKQDAKFSHSSIVTERVLSILQLTNSFKGSKMIALFFPSPVRERIEGEGPYTARSFARFKILPPARSSMPPKFRAELFSLMHAHRSRY